MAIQPTKPNQQQDRDKWQQGGQRQPGQQPGQNQPGQTGNKGQQDRGQQGKAGR